MPFSEAFYQRSSRRRPLAGLRGEGRTGEKLSSSGTGPLQQVDSGLSLLTDQGKMLAFLRNDMWIWGKEGRKERKRKRSRQHCLDLRDAQQSQGYETHVLMNSWNVRNGVPRSIARPAGNGPQAKVKVTGKLTLENQFFLTSKAGATLDSLGPLRDYLFVTGWAVMAYLFKCLLKTTVFTTFELSFL